MAIGGRPRGRRPAGRGMLEYQDLIGESAPRLSLDMKLPQSNPSYELAMFLRTTEPRHTTRSANSPPKASRGRSLQRRLVEYWKPPPPEQPGELVPAAATVMRRKRSKSLRRQIIEYWKPGRMSDGHQSKAGSVITCSSGERTLIRHLSRLTGSPGVNVQHSPLKHSGSIVQRTASGGVYGPQDPKPAASDRFECEGQKYFELQVPNLSPLETRPDHHPSTNGIRP